MKLHDILVHIFENLYKEHESSTIRPEKDLLTIKYHYYGESIVVHLHVPLMYLNSNCVIAYTTDKTDVAPDYDATVLWYHNSNYIVKTTDFNYTNLYVSAEETKFELDMFGVPEKVSKFIDSMYSAVQYCNTLYSTNYFNEIEFAIPLRRWRRFIS